MNYNKSLDKLVRGLELTDVWARAHPRDIHEQYNPYGAARLDLFLSLRAYETAKLVWKQ